MKRWGLILLSAVFLSTCKKKDSDTSEEPWFNLFTVEDDLKLGQQVAQEIESDPQKYPILDSAQYPAAYAHIYRMRNTILATGKLKYADRFPWRIRIIRDDSTLNAFCAPGGYIYIYTGIIKYLRNEAELIGVLGHEMAHADRRHVSQLLTQAYGIQTLLSLITGNQEPSLIEQIATNLLLLSFSRDHERDADNHSVIYLCPTDYKADGAAYFFEYLTQDGGIRPPEFLSTHPDPGERVQNIRQKAQEMSCTGSQTYDARYEQLKASLP
ncbi:MAG: M48 family metalloprotease [Bacteroidia bacterium]|nr:M48 family metalloprotease [Bacteroidia bacterium]MCX7651390.1 M48 family metalloprotease [Bacteroidia bacterium]MDW8416710.1 M48 family metalloprotease [Bacteroidia bacterium]